MDFYWELFLFMILDIYHKVVCEAATGIIEHRHNNFLDLFFVQHSMRWITHNAYTLVVGEMDLLRLV